jgi:H+-translocating diphosphatase
LCSAIGLWGGALIGLVTEYYTSHAYHPVREMAEAYQQSASTGLILGYALGFKSTLIPLLIIAVTITVTHTITGMFGVAIAAIGMLSTLAMGLTVGNEL